jgi:hypothetical protein
MPNTLGYYNPVFYANEALIQLEKALGMAGRVYRGYEEERRTFGRGDIINIRRPSTFTAQNAPSTAQDVSPESVQISLNNWKEVKFFLTDRELAFTSERIIEEHIRPAAIALADNIDQALVALYKDVPWHYTTNAAPGSVVTDLTGPHKQLFDNRVPMNDPSMLHFMVDGTMQQNLLSNSAFSQWQGAGNEGVSTQLSGALGQRFGLNFFANQNVPTHTTTAVSLTSGALNGAATRGATTINIDATTLTGTIVPGDVIRFTGVEQRYAVTTTNTASGNAMNGVGISPALQTDIADNTVIAGIEQAVVDNVQRLAFHRNAFALVLAPLPETGQGLGANIATVTDPITGLSLRSRIFYDGGNSRVFVALDVLYGVKTLDPNAAVRVVI